MLDKALSDTPEKRPVIALVAGETSGDHLGAPLIAALKRTHPHARFVGIGGPRMQAQGFDSWHDMQALSVMGFTEVLRHLPRLLALRKHLVQQLIELEPDVFIGIDAPDFNLGVEKKLKQAGITTLHYVSPSIWAWRENRAKKIGKAVHRILCLFPMEPPIYAKHHIDARFTGHPLATRFPVSPDREAARKRFCLTKDQPVLAILPGSRSSEISRLGAVFFDAAQRINTQISHLRILVPTANTDRQAQIKQIAARYPQLDIQILAGQAHEAMTAADTTLLASGTATLEAMLAKCPMVVGYRVSPVSYAIAKLLRMLKTDIYALPNILARNQNASAPLPVPEHMQSHCTAENLAQSCLALLQDKARQARIRATFTTLHYALLNGVHEVSPADLAANAVADFMATSDNTHAHA